MSDFRDKYIASLEEQVEMCKQQNLQQQEIITDLREKLRAAQEKRSSVTSSLTSVPLSGLGSILGNKRQRTSDSLDDFASTIINQQHQHQHGSASAGNSPLILKRPLHSNTSSPTQSISPPISGGGFNYTLPSFGNRLGGMGLPNPDSSIFRPYTNFTQLTLPRSTGPACDGCRIRKRKCGREKPFCSYCVRLNRNKAEPNPCTYPSQYAIKPNNPITKTSIALASISTGFQKHKSTEKITPPSSAPASAHNSPTQPGLALSTVLEHGHTHTYAASAPTSPTYSKSPKSNQHREKLYISPNSAPISNAPSASLSPTSEMMRPPSPSKRLSPRSLTRNLMMA